MSDTQEPRDPATGSAGQPVEDDEPTLETFTTDAEDDPTLETEGGARDSTMEQQLRPSGKWGSRLERMTAVRKERRRQVINRLWLTATPVLVLVVVAVVMLAVYGGQGRGGTNADITSAVTYEATEGSAILLIEDEGLLSTVVLLQPWGGGGVVMGVPGITLLEVQGAFSTLAQTYADEGPDAVKTALSQAFDVPFGPVAVADRQSLQAALAAGSMEALSEEVSSSVQAESEAVAEAMRGLVSDYTSDPAGAWDELALMGEEESKFLDAVRLDAASMAQDVWAVGTLSGRVARGEDFSYLEPDIETARALLVVVVEDTVVSVEIRDGAGVEGAARSAGELLETAGFELAPMSYAQAYPNVQTSQIVASAEDAEYAQQVASVLGVGEVVADDKMGPGEVVVVLGKDFGASPATSATDTE